MLFKIFFGEHEHWFSFQNQGQFENLSVSLRILEAETSSLVQLTLKLLVKISYFT